VWVWVRRIVLGIIVLGIIMLRRIMLRIFVSVVFGFGPSSFALIVIVIVVVAAAKTGAGDSACNYGCECNRNCCHPKQNRRFPPW